MVIVLIGMSGAGKTTWAGRLRDVGFAAFHCDERIGEKLRLDWGAPVTEAYNHSGWLGLPDEPGFVEREEIYLRCETEALHEAAEQARRCRDEGRRLVIDTGGSAIYAGEEVFSDMRRLATVVYLAVPPALHQAMLESYLRAPRALIWNGGFAPRPGESREEAFARCYPELICARERFYERYSDVCLRYEEHRSPALSAEGFLRRLSPRFPTHP